MKRGLGNEQRRFKIDGQEYTIVGKQGYWQTEDRYIEMEVYEAICAHPGCHRTFRYPGTKTNIKRKNVNRRCPLHKAPGVPVVARKKAKPAAAAKLPRGYVARQRALRDARVARSAARAAETPQAPSYLD